MGTNANLNIDLELELARDPNGYPLSESKREKIRAFMAEPTAATWDKICGMTVAIMEHEGEVKKLSLFRAVTHVDPTFPTQVREFQGERVWFVVPTPETVAAALRYATH